jgi:acyl-CoA thioester hydrolase
MANLLSMKESKISDVQVFRPRYSEVDQMGVVYYGNYASYFEVGRVELLRKCGLSYAELEAQGTMLPVVHMEVDFKKGARYDQEIFLETEIRQLPTRKISFYHTLRDSSDNVLVTGNVVLVFVDTETFKPKRCPEALEKLLLKELDS